MFYRFAPILVAITTDRVIDYKLKYGHNATVSTGS